MNRTGDDVTMGYVRFGVNKKVTSRYDFFGEALIQVSWQEKTVPVPSVRQRHFSACRSNDWFGMSHDANDVGALIILGVVIYGLWSTYESWDSATVYRMRCFPESSPVYLLDASQCLRKADVVRVVSGTTFQVDFSNQRVLENGVFLTRHDDCAVADSENWRCSEKASHITFGMTEGTFHSTDQTAKVINYPEYLMYRWGLAK